MLDGRFLYELVRGEEGEVLDRGFLYKLVKGGEEREVLDGREGVRE